VTRGSNLWDVRCSVLTDNVEELSGKIELARDSVRIK
jgi:hypothetical protein